MDDISFSTQPWRVSFSPGDEDRVVRIHLGTTTVVLPALEAHKLGSALHAASGLEVTPDAGDDDLPDALNHFKR